MGSRHILLEILHHYTAFKEAMSKFWKPNVRLWDISNFIFTATDSFSIFTNWNALFCISCLSTVLLWFYLLSNLGAPLILKCLLLVYFMHFFQPAAIWITKYGKVYAIHLVLVNEFTQVIWIKSFLKLPDRF